MTVHVHWSSGVPVCEGWLDKYSVGRSFLSTKRWQRRYVIVTREGIGYTRSCPTKPLRPSLARCFIPFAVPGQGGEVRLRPVYFLRHVTPLMHPQVPDTCERPLSSSSSQSEPFAQNFYFALSFVEGRQRYFLLLRAASLEEHNIWTLVLSAYVPAGSINTVIPIPHPLETQRHNCGSIFCAGTKLFAKAGAETTQEPVSGLYAKDPDPCTPTELSKICGRVHEWDEGERMRCLYLWNKVNSMPGKAPFFEGHNDEECTKLQNVTEGLEVMVVNAEPKRSSLAET